jgi:UbiD family decarboxylase
MPRAEAHLRLRDYVDDLAALGWLRDVDRPVDKDWEIACIGRWALESTGEDDAYAIRFNRVIGYDVPVVLGLFTSRRHIARSLGVAPDALLDRWAHALERPLPPEVVPDGLAKQVIRRGRDADVTRLPIPVWTPGRDHTPYLSSACVVTVDYRHRVPNLGTYRIQVRGPRELGLFFGSPKQHGAMHLKTFEDHDEPMPVALVVGGAPAVSYAAAAKLRYGVDEMTVAGGLAGRPIPVVRCETSELRVPADAEFVIEGIVRPHVSADEGPFGEALGYMEGVAPAPVIEVTCITHAARPIFHGLVQQLPPSEGHLLMEMGLVGSLWHHLKAQGRVEGLTDLAIVPGTAGVSAVCAAIRRGDAKSVAALVRIMTLLNWGQKLVVVVDDDIDVRDPKSILWAVSSRADFATDVTTQTGVPLFQRDPAAFRRAGDVPESSAGDLLRGTKVIIDATTKADCMEVSLPARALMERTRAAWDALGLPPLTGVSRLERLVDQHAEGGIEYRLPTA